MRAVQVKWCENKKFSDDFIKKFMLKFGCGISRLCLDDKDFQLPIDAYIDKHIDDDCFLSEFRSLYEKVEYGTDEKLRALPIVVVKREVDVSPVLGDLVIRQAIEGKPFYPVDASSSLDSHGRNIPIHGFGNFYQRLMDEIEDDDFFYNEFATGRKSQKENCCLATSYFLKSQPLIHYFSCASWTFSGYMHLNNLVSYDDERNIGGDVVEISPKWREIDER